MAEKKINGRTFRVEPMLATDALVLQARLFKALGPAVAHFGDLMKGLGKDKTEADEAKSNAAALASLASIFSQGEPEQIAKLIKDIAEVAQIRRESGDYDHVDLDGDMTGKAKDLFPLLLFVLKEQFTDFFQGLPGFGNLKKVAGVS